ncbi:hypothetical protein SLA2020_241050 [Shorea laevis]
MTTSKKKTIPPPSGKITRGRQKIEMKMIEKEEDRLITFSKRRSGIYKKASELITLCGAEIGFVVFSPAGKPFSFGHPSVESVVNRFLEQNPPPNDNTHPLVEAHRKMRISQLEQQYNQLIEQLEAEVERGKVIAKLNSGIKSKGWWEVPMDKLNLEELKQFGNNVDALRNRVCGKLNEKLATQAPASGPAPRPGLMDSAHMMNGYVNDGAGPSSYVPGTNYGFPRRGQF